MDNVREYVSGVDLIIPVYKPDEKFDRLIEKLKTQTVKPGKVFLMQTLTGDEAADEVLSKKLLKVPDAVVTTLPRTAPRRNVASGER